MPVLDTQGQKGKGVYGKVLLVGKRRDERELYLFESIVSAESIKPKLKPLVFR